MEGTAHSVEVTSRARTPRGRLRFRDVLGLVLVLVGALASMATNLAEEPEEAADTAEEQAALVPCTGDAECAATPETSHCLTSYAICVECLDDDACDAQSRCFEHRCVEVCESDEACPGELICLDGLCRPCALDAECADPGKYCYVGPDFSACRPLCSGSSECGGPGYVEGDVCRAGHCQQVDCQFPQDCLLDRETCDVEVGLCRSLE